jgi:hypothetical protein
MIEKEKIDECELKEAILENNTAADEADTIYHNLTGEMGVA